MSTPRLPVPGEDGGNWGEILNEYLLVAHNNNGTLKAESIIVGKADKTYVDVGLQTKANISSLSTVATTGSYYDLQNLPVIADDATTVHLSGTQTITGEKNFTGGFKISGASLATVATSGSYTNLTDKPTIPDNTALVHLAGNETITGSKNFTGGLNAGGKAVVVFDDGRLSNTRTPTDDSVTTAKLQDESITEPKLLVTNEPTEGDFLKWDGNDFYWEAQVARGVVTKADVGLGNVDNTSDANKPVSSATQTALNLKANLDDSRFTNTRIPTDSSVTTAKIQDNNITEPKLAISNSPTNGNVLSWDGTDLTWTAQASAPVQSVAGKTGTVTLVKGDVGLGNVDNTADLAKPISTSAQAALDLKANTNDARFTDSRTPSDNTVSTGKVQDNSITEPKLAVSNAPTGGNFLSWDGTDLTWAAQSSAPVTSVSGRTGAVTLTKTDVSLGNVDNTSDANKPVSTATQTAINAKQSTSAKGQADGYASLDSSSLVPRAQLGTGTADGTKVLYGDGTWAAPGSAPVQSVAGKTGVVTLVKGDVGLGNVDNTTDAGKPVSTATQTALNAKANSADLSTVAITGSYVNLLNKPTIPVVGTTSGTYAEGNDTRITGAVQKSTATTKGDILVTTASATIDRLGVGTDGQVLTADSTQASGVKWGTAAGGNGITRSIVTVSSNQTAGTATHTDYVYIVTGSYTLTLPAAASNTNKYTIKNRHSGDITLAFNASENADGGGVTLGTNSAIDLVSDGSNWVII